jgi:hypothetical protein
VAREQKKNDLTFKAFLDKHYEPWALEHQKRGQETLQRFRSVFADLLDDKLSALTAWRIEKWRTDRLKGIGARKPKPATVNSHLVMLKSALNKAVSWKVLAVHPLKDVKALKTDKAGRIRYLSPDEEKRLRLALDARDQRTGPRSSRSSARPASSRSRRIAPRLHWCSVAKRAPRHQIGSTRPTRSHHSATHTRSCRRDAERATAQAPAAI